MNNNHPLLLKFATKPVIHHYSSPNEADIQWLQRHAAIATAQSNAAMRVENSYYQAGLPGTLPDCYGRQAILLKCQQLVELIAPTAGVLIFDIFRTIATQAELFKIMQASIKKLHPYFSEAQLRAETCKYVAPATDNEDTQLPNHNTGGAIDLTLFDLVTGEPWDFGTEFDHTSELAHSDFFEGPVEPAYGIDEVRWLLIRRNRRVLFHLMKQLGFVNYHYEWWHYDLGDCHWANIHGLDWHYASMENDFILKKLTAYT